MPSIALQSSHTTCVNTKVVQNYQFWKNNPKFSRPFHTSRQTLFPNFTKIHHNFFRNLSDTQINRINDRPNISQHSALWRYRYVASLWRTGSRQSQRQQQDSKTFSQTKGYILGKFAILSRGKLSQILIPLAKFKKIIISHKYWQKNI